MESQVNCEACLAALSKLVACPRLPPARSTALITAAISLLLYRQTFIYLCIHNLNKYTWIYISLLFRICLISNLFVIMWTVKTTSFCCESTIIEHLSSPFHSYREKNEIVLYNYELLNVQSIIVTAQMRRDDIRIIFLNNNSAKLPTMNYSTAMFPSVFNSTAVRVPRFLASRLRFGASETARINRNT